MTMAGEYRTTSAGTASAMTSHPRIAIAATRPPARHTTGLRCACPCSLPWYGSGGTRTSTPRSIRPPWAGHESSRTWAGGWRRPGSRWMQDCC